MPGRASMISSLSSRPGESPRAKRFEVELRDRNGTPPDDVRIHYLYDNDGHPTEEVESMHLLDGLLVARKENVARPFKYRAEGETIESMEWISLEVVEPPRIESLAGTLYPPAYTGWPDGAGRRIISTPRGTRVAFAAETTKRLQIRHAATCRRRRICPASCEPTVMASSWRPTPREPFVIDKSGTYSFELVDAEGLLGRPGQRVGNSGGGRSAAERERRATRRQLVRHARGRRAAAESWQGRSGRSRRFTAFQPLGHHRNLRRQRDFALRGGPAPVEPRRRPAWRAAWRRKPRGGASLGNRPLWT